MRTDDLIEQFENETELPATWSNSGMGGYTKEYTEWLQQQLVNKNDLLQRVSKGEAELLIAFAHRWNDCDAPLIEDEYVYDYLEGNL